MVSELISIHKLAQVHLVFLKFRMGRIVIEAITTFFGVLRIKLNKICLYPYFDDFNFNGKLCSKDKSNFPIKGRTVLDSLSYDLNQYKQPYCKLLHVG